MTDGIEPGRDANLSAETATELWAQLEAERIARQTAESARDDAMAAGRAKSEFVAMLSHEIRTPLNGVLGMIELLQNTRLDPEQREFVATLLQSAQSLMGVVNDVLDFTAIEGNRVELEVSEFSAARLAQDAVALMRPMAEQKGLDLLLWVGPLPRRLTGNPTRLQQVLVNLLSNAIKVTEQGEVRLDLSATRVSATRAQAESWRLTCTVTDSSAGIEQAALARLRDAIDDDRLIDTSDTSAAGMRVSIAARLLKQVSGDLRIEIEPGKGCRIIVSAVLDEAGSDAIARIEMPPKPVVLDQLRVLVAEDNPVNQTLAMAVLGRFGIQAELARDGNEALAAVRQKPFDIVLMDMRMPNLDGLEATRAIRALPDRQGRPWIIAVTANAFDQDRQQCLEAGMNDFLPKPFNQAALRAALMNARLPG